MCAPANSHGNHYPERKHTMSLVAFICLAVILVGGVAAGCRFVANDPRSRLSQWLIQHGVARVVRLPITFLIGAFFGGMLAATPFIVLFEIVGVKTNRSNADNSVRTPHTPGSAASTASTDVDELLRLHADLEHQWRDKNARVLRVITNNNVRAPKTRDAVLPGPKVVPLPSGEQSRILAADEASVASLHKEMEAIRARQAEVEKNLAALGRRAPVSPSCDKCKGSGMAYRQKYTIVGYQDGIPQGDYVYQWTTCNKCQGQGR